MKALGKALSETALGIGSVVVAMPSAVGEAVDIGVAKAGEIGDDIKNLAVLKPPACCANLSEEHKAIAAQLMTRKLGQAHIFDAWPPAGEDDAKKAACLDQLLSLDRSYPGGLVAYVASARRLLSQSQKGENPLSGWTPSVPDDGFDIAPGDASGNYDRYERAGIREAARIGFVVPAGGLGERLGYHGVKFALPSEVSSGALVLETYCGYIRACERMAQLQRAAAAKEMEVQTSAVVGGNGVSNGNEKEARGCEEKSPAAAASPAPAPAPESSAVALAGTTAASASADASATAAASSTTSAALTAPSSASATALSAAAAAAASKPVRLPLAIMVSDDTEGGIKALLESHSYFGLSPDQVTLLPLSYSPTLLLSYSPTLLLSYSNYFSTSNFLLDQVILLKQEKVAALAHADGRFAVSPSDPYTILTKPHGHGDIHFLLHSSGTARRWRDALGICWLHLFQDTNTLYFSDFLATVGVSALHGVAVNLVATPRKAKEAIGAVCRLDHADGKRSMVANVEYNQLEPLLKASGFPDGDVNEPDGFSRFPGNINQIVISLSSWLETVEASGGAIDEFINPKYTDASRTEFKSPTRLECMMQDYVKTVPSDQKVAWTRFPLWLGYFPCKNDILSAAKLSADGVPPHSASSSEMAVYQMHCQSLRTLGAKVAQPSPRTFRGVQVDVGASVVLAPSFAPCFTLLREKLPTPDAISISASSHLVVKGESVVIERLELSGALVIDVADGGSLLIRSLKVSNKGWAFVELTDAQAESADEATAIRGYRLDRRETKTIAVKKDEHLVIEHGRTKRAAAPPIKLEALAGTKKEPPGAPSAAPPSAASSQLQPSGTTASSGTAGAADARAPTVNVELASGGGCCALQ